MCLDLILNPQLTYEIEIFDKRPGELLHCEEVKLNTIFEFENKTDSGLYCHAHLKRNDVVLYEWIPLFILPGNKLILDLHIKVSDA